MNPKPIYPSDIIRTVAKVLNVLETEITGPTRPARVAWARQVAMLLCFERGLSQVEISMPFGRTRNAVDFAVKRARWLMEAHPECAQDVGDCRRAIGEL